MLFTLDEPSRPEIDISQLTLGETLDPIQSKNLNTSAFTGFESITPSKIQSKAAIDVKSNSSHEGTRSVNVSRNKDPNEKLSTNVLIRKVMLKKADSRLDKIIAKFDPEAPNKTG